MADMAGFLRKLFAGGDLSAEEADSILESVFAGDVPDVQLAAFLAALEAKGVSAGEIVGLARSLRRHAVPVEANCGPLLDTCGTGGAAVKTFNVSTAAALVAAGAGAHVAKHGNRGITSACGSADVLEALGVKIDCRPGVVARCIREAGIGFMFAPLFHPAMGAVQPVRRALGVRTVFNILGPLANPAGASLQVLGVASEGLMQIIAEALKLLGTGRAMVVHAGGLDELSTFSPTMVLELSGGRIEPRVIDAAELGLAKARGADLAGGDAAANAAIIRAVLRGEDTGPRRDIVLLNAAAAVLTAGLAEEMAGALEAAADSVESGRALASLEKLIEISGSSGDPSC